MKSLCVFMGSSIGRDPNYRKITEQFGEELAKRNMTLIYGGGKLGLMGTLADTVLRKNGKVIGITTKQLYTHEAHLGLTDLHVVDSLQERKKMMVQLADGIIALPGGLGTLDEIFDILNAIKLKIYDKPFGIFNANQYFNKLIEFINYTVHEEFLKLEFQKLIKISDDPAILLDALMKQNTPHEITRIFA